MLLIGENYMNYLVNGRVLTIEVTIENIINMQNYIYFGKFP